MEEVKLLIPDEYMQGNSFKLVNDCISNWYPFLHYKITPYAMYSGVYINGMFSEMLGNKVDVTNLLEGITNIGETGKPFKVREGQFEERATDMKIENENPNQQPPHPCGSKYPKIFGPTISSNFYCCFLPIENTFKDKDCYKSFLKKVGGDITYQYIYKWKKKPILQRSYKELKPIVLSRYLVGRNGKVYNSIDVI